MLDGRPAPGRTQTAIGRRRPRSPSRDCRCCWQPAWAASESSPPQPELALLFNRPIRVDRLELRDTYDGREVAGQRFLSIFDMAVVVHPAGHFRVVVGEVLQVDGRAADRRGRLGRRAGESPSWWSPNPEAYTGGFR